MLAPAVVVLVVVLLVPLLFSLRMSLFDWSMLSPTHRWVGLGNYRRLLADPGTLASLGITTTFTAVSIAAETVLGMALALLLNAPLRGLRAVRTFVLLPMMVAPVVAALSWRLLLDSDFGVLNYLLAQVGLPPQLWLGRGLALASLIAVEVWENTPFVVLMLLAGLQALPQALLEAARVDGAGFWQQFRSITLPLLSPVLLVTLVFRTMFTIRVFDVVWVLTGGGPADRTLTLSVDIYRTAFRYADLGSASTLSWLLLLVTVAITAVYLRVLQREALA